MQFSKYETMNCFEYVVFFSHEIYDRNNLSSYMTIVGRVKSLQMTFAVWFVKL